tara:strand:- start:3733 stop:4575 length:843 start_codon:yes stop_codon:yes gene_type:complete
MIYSRELDENFETKELLFDSLRKNIKEIINIKRAKIQKSLEKGSSVKCKVLDVSKIDFSNKDFVKDDNFYYIAVNTTWILDSHIDLHVDGLWTKSAKERNRRNYLVDTHIMTMGTTLAKKEDVEILVENMPFSALGFNYKGNTQVLIYKIPKDKLSKLAKDWIDEGYSIEASVKMQYVIIDFAMNSILEEDESSKKLYDEYINKIANKKEFEDEYGEIPYFFIIREAKNIDESSLCLRGSNPVTGEIKNIEPSKDTQKQKEAEKSLQLEKQKFITNLLNI